MKMHHLFTALGTGRRHELVSMIVKPLPSTFSEEIVYEALILVNPVVFVSGDQLWLAQETLREFYENLLMPYDNS